MLKKGWRKLKQIFEQGPVKMALRRLPKADRVKYESLVRKQDELARKFKKVLSAYEDKFLAISHLLEQSRQGEVRRLAKHITDLQGELESSLERAGISVSRTVDLKKELADRRRGLRIYDAQDEHERRLDWLKDELIARGLLANEDHDPIMSDVLNHSEKEPTEVADIGSVRDFSDQPAYYQSAEAVEEEAEQPMVDFVLSTDEVSGYLALDANQMAERIKELSRELAEYQSTPQAEPLESLRTAKQIRDLHALLRKADRKDGIQRDRLSMTDGFEHVFSRH